MKYLINFLGYKVNINKLWKQNYKLTLLILNFHKLLIKGENSKLKILLGEKKLPNDSIDRVQRFTTIFQKINDNCEWNSGYTIGNLSELLKKNRPYMIPIAISVFECLTELTTGPCPENQMKIYTYIFNRYVGNLKRYVSDSNSNFHKMKVI